MPRKIIIKKPKVWTKKVVIKRVPKEPNLHERRKSRKKFKLA